MDQPVPPLPQSPSNRAGQTAGLDVGDSVAAATAASTTPPLRHDPPKFERDRHRLPGSPPQRMSEAAGSVVLLDPAAASVLARDRIAPVSALSAAASAGNLNSMIEELRELRDLQTTHGPGTGAAGGSTAPTPAGPAVPGNVFTIDHAAVLARTTQGCHKEMRRILQDITAAFPETPVGAYPMREPVRVDLPHLTPWRDYLAHHKKAAYLIGPGVVDVYLQFRTRTDANRVGQLRLDFVVLRVDGTIITFHPGKTPKGDAQLHLYEANQFRA